MARALRALGRHRRSLPRHRDHRRRPGLRCDEPQDTPAAAAGALRRTRRAGAVPHRGSGRRHTAHEHDLVVAADGANSAVAHEVRRRLRAVGGGAPQQVHVAGHRPGVRGVQVLHLRDAARRRCRCTATPTTQPGSTFIVEMHEDVWRRAGFAESASTEFPPGVSDEKSVARIEDLIGDLLQGRRILLNNSKWQSFTTIAQRHVAIRQRGAARRRRAHRALLDRLRHEAGDGGRPGARRMPARARGRRCGARGVRGRAAPCRAVHPARGAAQLEWFENIGHYVDQDAGAVRVQHRHPQPPHHLRQPARCATPSSSPDGRLVRRARGRAWRAADARQHCAADVPAVPARRPGAEEPGRRLADGHVLRGRRAARRLPPRPPRRARRSAAPVW